MKDSETIVVKRIPLITLILFWSGLVVVSNLYITIPLVPVFVKTFDATSSQAALTSSSFSLAYAIGFLLFGPLLDRYGRKQIILSGLVLLSFFSPLAGLFNNLTLLIIIRGIQGFAASTFAPAALAYVVEMFPPDKRVTTIGFISTGFLMAGIIGQVVSSLVTQLLNWSYVFYLLGAVYLLTTVLVALFIPKGIKHEIKGNSLDFFKQVKEIFKQKNLIYSYFITLMLLFSFVGMYTVFGSYLVRMFTLTSNDILLIRTAGIFGMLLSPFAGKLVAKYSTKTVLRGGLTFAVIGLVCLGVSTNLDVLIVMSVVFVAGISVIVPTLIAFIGQLAGTARGIAVSLYTFILFLGATLGPIIVISVMETGNYALTFNLLALLLGIALIVTFFIDTKISNERL